jgi:hypothetical protein
MSEPAARAAAATQLARAVIAVLLFAGAFTYRFNTLGGRFGGFEDDHFVSFAYAKQVEAGEQPLRDFAGLGLQGAWPSLTYEASAFAQRWLGDDLRSEALLTVAGVAVAVVLTFLAATRVSNLGWATAATVLSVLIAPTLYNYTKVLSLGAAAFAITRYADRPTLGRVAVSAVVTSVAFLFRHDLAAYIGVGVLVVTLAVGPWRQRARHTAAYLLLTLVLLTPSLVYVQYYDGLFQYFRDGLSLSQREAERTPLLEWPSFVRPDAAAMKVVGFFGVESNATSWLFYVTWLMPLIAVVLVWRQTRDARFSPERIAVIAIAVMTLFAARFLIRGNVGARLGDVGPLFAVLLAAICHTATRVRPADALWLRIARPAAILVLLASVALSAETVGSVGSQLRTARMTSWGDAWQHAHDVAHELQAQPGTPREELDQRDPLALAQYLNRCTAATDRVVLMTYRPVLLPFAGRLFGAGRLSLIPGYVLDERYQRAAIAWWQRQAVPIVIVEFDPFVDPQSTLAPLVRDFLLAHYAPAAVAGDRGGHPLQVFLRRDLSPRATFGPRQLPCPL